MGESATVGLKDLRDAARRVEGRLRRTPLLSSHTLSRMGGCRVHLKAELFQRTGSFKPRGGLNTILQLSPDEAARGVITISAGNHAQGVAFAARQVGVRATVVMPAGAVPSKVAATRDYGAEVILEPDVHQAFETVERLRQERNLTFIHPFDSDRLIVGHGTLGLELCDDLPEMNAVVVPVGGGGLLAGVAAAVRACGSRARVYAVEPQGAPTLTRALEAGRPVRLERLDTIADGLAPPFVGERNLELARRLVEDVVLVSDAEIARAVRLLLERCKLAAEPAGAAATAALLAGRLPVKPGWDVALVVSGGNLDVQALPRLMELAAGRGEGESP